MYAGVGLFHFNPSTKDLNGNKTYLKPLSTEGQGFMPGIAEYGLWQLNIPFGIGAEYSLNEDMRVGLEMGYRKLFTDHLDDVGGLYPDNGIMREERGEIAAYFSDPAAPTRRSTMEGIERGNAQNMDTYWFTGFTFSYIFWRGTCDKF